MKTFAPFAVAVAVVALAAGPVWAQGTVGRPINKMCPFKPGSKASPTLVVTYKGKTVGFCCEDCVDKFKKNPARYIGGIKADADPYAGPDNAMKDGKSALEAGKGGGYAVVLLFATQSKSSKMWNLVLTESKVYEQLLQTAYARVEFKRDDPLVKQFAVKSAPALYIIDPKGEKPTVLKKITKGVPKTVAAELEKANKKVQGLE